MKLYFVAVNWCQKPDTSLLKSYIEMIEYSDNSTFLETVGAYAIMILVILWNAIAQYCGVFDMCIADKLDLSYLRD